MILHLAAEGQRSVAGRLRSKRSKSVARVRERPKGKRRTPATQRSAEQTPAASAQLTAFGPAAAAFGALDPHRFQLILNELSKHPDIAAKYLDYLMTQELKDNSKWIIGSGSMAPLLNLTEGTTPSATAQSAK